MADRRVEQAIRTIIEKGWNQGEVEALLGACTPEYRRTGSTTLEGAAQFAEWVTAMRAAIPDLHVAIEDIVSEDGRGAARTVISGTHATDSFGLPATGARFSADSIVVVHLEGDRVCREWECTDTPSLRAQLKAALR